MLLSRDAAHLENVNEIRIEDHLQREINVNEVEVLEAQAVEEYLGCQQLFTADVYRVLGEIKRVPKRDVAGGELDLRSESLFSAR